MKGFDSEFVDFPDYILRITARIWEGRQVGAIRRYYAKDCPVRAPAGLVVGSEAVVAATLATLAEFPDRRLLGEDVVWKGGDEGGYLSSHRIVSTATHAGGGAFGAATGRRLKYRIIADCWVRENQVVEEWLVRDQAAIAACLGMSARQMAESQTARGDAGFFTPDNDAPSAYALPMQDDDADGAAYLNLYRRLWEEADLSAVSACYDAAATLRAPGNAAHSGRAEIDWFHLGYLAAFRGAKFEAHDLTVCENAKGKTVSLRWSATGAYSGAGAFAGGEASAQGAPLYLMAISQARICAGKIVEEWLLADEVAVWKQIIAAR